MLAPAAISALSYELGRARRIDELPEVSARPDVAALLTPERAGLRLYRESDEPPAALALRCARRTLDQSGLRPGAVDAVVFASDSLVDPPALAQLLIELELVDAYPLNVSLSDCANLPIALRVAAALVRAGEFATVLLVSVDVARVASPATRLIGEGMAVASDAAASALVAREPGAFVIEAAAQQTHAAAANGDRQSRLIARVRAHQGLFARLFARAAITPAAVRRVFPNHFAAPVLLPFFEASGFSRGQLHLESAAAAGHCFGSDCLIGLADYTRSTPVEAGERFLLVGAGVSQLGAVLLRAAYPSAPDGAGGPLS